MSATITSEELRGIIGAFEKLAEKPIVGRDGREYYKLVIHESWFPVIAQEAVAITEEDDLHAEFPNAKHRWRDFLIYDHIPYGENSKSKTEITKQ